MGWQSTVVVVDRISRGLQLEAAEGLTFSVVRVKVS